MAKYLLDTQIFIWANQEPNKIPNSIKRILSQNHHTFYLSMASIWEMQIKIQLDKLQLKPSLSSALKIIQDKGIYEILPITQTHILNLQTLEFHHKDPFDRMIISQAMCEHLTVLTVDSEIVKYPIKYIN